MHPHPHCLAVGSPRLYYRLFKKAIFNKVMRMFCFALFGMRAEQTMRFRGIPIKNIPLRLEFKRISLIVVWLESREGEVQQSW